MNCQVCNKQKAILAHNRVNTCRKCYDILYNNSMLKCDNCKKLRTHSSEPKIIDVIKQTYVDSGFTVKLFGRLILTSGCSFCVQSTEDERVFRGLMWTNN